MPLFGRFFVSSPLFANKSYQLGALCKCLPGTATKDMGSHGGKGRKSLCQNDKSSLDIFLALKRDIYTIYVDVVIRAISVVGGGG